MTTAKLSSGDLNNYGGFTGGNDGTMVVEVGPAGSKVLAAVFATDGTPTFIKQPIVPAKTYQNVLSTPGRALSTNYTNSSGTEITVVVAVDLTNPNSVITAIVGGVAFTISTGTTAGYRGTGIFQVPSAAVYQVAATGTLAQWVEYRP